MISVPCGSSAVRVTMRSRETEGYRQGEYYVTDCPGILQAWGETVRALPVLQPCEALSINTFSDLAVVEAAMEKMGL